MKKSHIALIIVCAAVVILLIVGFIMIAAVGGFVALIVGLVVSSDDENGLMDWKSEVETVEFYGVDEYEAVMVDGESVTIPRGDFGDCCEVFCVYDDRIYFASSKGIPDTRYRRVWGIMSCDLNGENVEEHFRDDLFKTAAFTGYNYMMYTYNLLKYASNREHGYGGLYEDGKIYLRGADRTVVYDIKTDTISEVDRLPQNRYSWVDISDGNMNVKDNLTGETKNITIEQFAQKNEYAKMVLDNQTNRYVFATVCSTEKGLYIVCPYMGEFSTMYAVVFLYDFDSDSVKYVTYTPLNYLDIYEYSIAEKVN